MDSGEMTAQAGRPERPQNEPAHHAGGHHAEGHPRQMRRARGHFGIEWGKLWADDDRACHEARRRDLDLDPAS